MKIVTIIGARPQFIKAATVSRCFRDLLGEGCEIEEILVHTGQHYDANMSEVFFDEMEIPRPHYHLGIGGCAQGAMTGRMLEKIEEVLQQEKPDWVLIYGDTNSTLAGALAAVKMHIPVAHVEAGLRSFNRLMPEEINRILADQCSEVLFTPTAHATKQLHQENIGYDKIHEVGDVMYDAALYYRDKALQTSQILKELEIRPKEYVLATIHRAENTDDELRLREIFEGLVLIAEKIPVVLPLHPRTKSTLERLNLLNHFQEKLELIDPVGYFDMIALENGAKVILTDSGGVQKEAYFFHVPCVTLRRETEWIELIEHGFNALVSLEREAIYAAYGQASQSNPDWSISLYGSGRASELIATTLIECQNKILDNKREYVNR